MGEPRYPSLFQVNTRVRLAELEAVLGRPATLDDITDTELDALARDGFDLVWFLGVWQTGPAARRSRVEPRLAGRVPARAARLPPVGRRAAPASPSATTTFTPTSAAMWRSRACGSGCGIAACAWSSISSRTTSRQTIRGSTSTRSSSSQASEDQLAAQPWNYRAFETASGRRILAYGRDPYFAGWPDTLQLNYGNPALQEAMLGELPARRRPVRRRPLRHGDARPAGGLRADVGHRHHAVLAAGHGCRPRRAPWLPLPRRGLLGSRVDAPAAGLRLHLRQAALRPAGRGYGPSGTGAPVRRPRLPGSPGPLSREPRRATGSGNVHAARSTGLPP